MPPKVEIDAAGAMHHIIVRGIERRKIFWDDVDRDLFAKRLGQVLTETHTDCFEWAEQTMQGAKIALKEMNISWDKNYYKSSNGPNLFSTSFLNSRYVFNQSFPNRSSK